MHFVGSPRPETLRKIRKETSTRTELKKRQQKYNDINKKLPVESINYFEMFISRSSRCIIIINTNVVNFLTLLAEGGSAHLAYAQSC